METNDLSELYAHFWGKTYVLVPALENGRKFILDAHRNPDRRYTGPLLSRLVDL
jgi:hypothetical protein